MKLKSHGHEAVLVGGCVRDYLLGKEPKDWDIATSALPDEVERIFSRSLPIGKSFGVITVLHGGESFEIATFRSDGEYTDGRRPESVQYASMEADASRRDLTINGLFFDVINGTIVDFVGGEKDLKSGIIRFIGNAKDRIMEDHLRILRALRFSIKYGFTIEPETLQIIQDHAHLLTNISSERIREELVKILDCKKYRQALELLYGSGVLQYILPSIAALKGCEQNPEWHSEGDVWEHSIIAMEHLPSDATTEMIWATLFHDVGKPLTSEIIDGKIVSHGHEKAGEELARQVLIDLKFPTVFIDEVTFAVGNHMRIKLAKEMKKSKIKKILSHEYGNTLLVVSYADSAFRKEYLDWYEHIQENIETWKAEGLAPEPYIRGADLINLGIKPGPLFKQILDGIYERQLECEFNCKEDALKYLLTVVPM